jgi:hypothetical protein
MTVYIPTTYKFRFIRTKRNFLVKINIKHGFLKPHAAQNSYFTARSHFVSSCHRSVVTGIFSLTFHSEESRDFGRLAFNRAPNLSSFFFALVYTFAVFWLFLTLTHSHETSQQFCERWYGKQNSSGNIFVTIFSTFPPRLTLLKIITTHCHLITCAEASTIRRTNVHWFEPTRDTWSDSQEEAKCLPPSERETLGLIKNWRPNQIQLTTVQ